MSGGRTSWAVPLLLFLAILLVAGLAFNLAYLDTGGEEVPTAPTAGGTSATSTGVQAIDFVRSAGAVVLIGAVIIFVYLFARQRKRRPHGEMPPATITDVIAGLLSMAMIIILLYMWPSLAKQAAQGNETAAPASGGNATTLTTASGVPAGFFLAAALLAALLVVAVILRPSFRHPMEPIPGRRARRAKAAEAVAVAIQDLELGGDVRETILDCFRRFCVILGQRGVQNQEPMTPRELEELAVGTFLVPRTAAEDLTVVFEEARYSEHTLGDAERDRALRSLHGIQAALGG